MSAHLWPAAPPRPIKWVATSARLVEALPARIETTCGCGGVGPTTSQPPLAPAGFALRLRSTHNLRRRATLCPLQEARSVSGTLLPSCIAPRTSRKMMQLAAASLRALAPRVAPPAACAGAAREWQGQGRFFPVHACHQRVIRRGGCLLSCQQRRRCSSPLCPVSLRIFPPRLHWRFLMCHAHDALMPLPCRPRVQHRPGRQG